MTLVHHRRIVICQQLHNFTLNSHTRDFLGQYLCGMSTALLQCSNKIAIYYLICMTIVNLDSRKASETDQVTHFKS